MYKKILIPCVVIIVGIIVGMAVFSGCIPPGQSKKMNTFQLRFTSPMPAALSKGDIAVQVVDQRPGGQGGGDPSYIGLETSNLGPLSKLWAPVGQTPPVIMKKMASEALASAGYRPVEPMVGAPTLTIALTSFWTTGLRHYTMTMNANLTLSGGSGGSWSEILVSQASIETGGQNYVAHFEAGYQNMLDQAVTQLVQKFQGAAFQAAAGGTAAAPAPTAPATATVPTAPAAPAAAECKLNSDCPIGQHCSANTCIYECREDRDCSDNQVCNTNNGTCEKGKKKMSK